ncbi:hypothetical protein ACHAXN_011275 [Cyclotella atomus]
MTVPRPSYASSPRNPTRPTHHINKKSSRHKHSTHLTPYSLDDNEECIPSTKSHLYSLLHRQLYDLALDHLTSHPNDARVWILHSDKRGVMHRSLPLHLACEQSQHGALPLLLIEKLLTCYPGASSQFNSNGNLPIHLACASISFIGPNHYANEGVLSCLIKVYPQCVMVVDGRGRSAVDILEEKGLNVKDRRGGSILRFMKSKMEEMRLNYDEDDYGLNEVQFECGKDEMEERDDAVSGGLRFELQREQRIDSFATSESPGQAASYNTADDGRYKCQSDRDEFDHQFHVDSQGDITPRHANRQRRLMPRNHAGEHDGGSLYFRSRNNTARKDRFRRRDRMDQYDDNAKYRDSNRLLAEADQSVETSRGGGSNRRYRSTQGKKRREPPRLQRSIANSLEYSYSSSDAQSPTDYSSDEYCHNHAPVVTPSNHCNLSASPYSTKSNNESNEINTSFTTNTDVFHHLEQEFRTMKCAHQSMSQLLNTKANNEMYLQSRLSNLEEAHAELRHEYNLQSSTNAELIQQNNDMERLLQDKDHELKIMRTKEGAISSELACRLRKDEEVQVRLKELTERLKNEELQRDLVEKEFQREQMATAQLRNAFEQATRSKEEMAKLLDAAAADQQSVQHENTLLRQNIASKNKELAEAKTKEISLCEQVMTKLALLESAEAVSKEKENQLNDEREKSRELEQELESARCTIRKKVETEEKLQTLLREEIAKNTALEIELSSMREKVEAAKEGLAYLQRGKVASNTASKNDDQLEENELEANGLQLAEITALSSSQSIELLSPMIQDALCIQQDTIDRARQLLNKASSTRRYVAQISDISTTDFSFQSTLHLLESILTTHIKTIKDLDDAIDFEESCHLELSSLLDIPLHEFDSEFDALKTKAAPQTRDSINSKRYMKLKAATISHMKKIENLHKMSLELQPAKSTKLSNEIASIFQQAMDALLEGTKQLSDMMQS